MDLYLRFLNKNGNDTFCRFGLMDKDVFKRKVYICMNTMEKSCILEDAEIIILRGLI